MHHLIQILRDVDEFEALAGLVTDRLEIHLQGRCLRANLRNGERLLSRCSFHPQESLLALRVGHLIQMPKNSASCTVCIIAGCSKARPSLRCALEVEMTPEDQFGHQMSVEPVTGRMPCQISSSCPSGVRNLKRWLAYPPVEGWRSPSRFSRVCRFAAVSALIALLVFLAAS